MQADIDKPHRTRKAKLMQVRQPDLCHVCVCVCVCVWGGGTAGTSHKSSHPHLPGVGKGC